MLMDIARKVQLTPTKHDEAQRHFEALCSHVDRPGSPLEGVVVMCYPGGSFATGTAIASSVSKDQHDVDVVMELDIDPESDPGTTLRTLFEAINGEPGSRYYGLVKLNSRCVTVTYADGVRVDLMPIARLLGEPDKAGNLFHWKRPAESFHKPVNPWGFAEHFNNETALDPVFAAMFESRGMLTEGVVAKGQTDPVPDHVPLTEKAARVVALQLIKRARDIRYRNRNGRKPPSIVLAALALEVPSVGAGLLDEIISIANHVAERLEREGSGRRVIEVRNPAYRADVFSDRWPEDLSAQALYARDLRYIVRQLARLRNENASLTETRAILDDLFGEIAAGYAIEKLLESTRRAMDDGSMRFAQTGKVLTGAAATAAAVAVGATAARASTNMGGGELPR
jgi:hypothetical protein